MCIPFYVLSWSGSRLSLKLLRSVEADASFFFFFFFLVIYLAAADTLGD